MTDLQALFTQYIEGNAKEQERAAKQIAQTNGAQAFLMEKLSGAQARAALALLGRAARRESVRWALMDKTQEIVPLLASEDAKTRKNAAIVLGQIGQRAVVPALCGALSKETQQFVRPSLDPLRWGSWAARRHSKPSRRCPCRRARIKIPWRSGTPSKKRFPG